MRLKTEAICSEFFNWLPLRPIEGARLDKVSRISSPLALKRSRRHEERLGVVALRANGRLSLVDHGHPGNGLSMTHSFLTLWAMEARQTRSRSLSETERVPERCAEQDRERTRRSHTLSPLAHGV